MTEQIKVQARLHYADVYDPRAFNEATPARYSIAFEPHGNDAAEELTSKGVLPRDRDGLFVASSAFPPSISTYRKKYDKLVDALQIADARNIRRDRLLRDLDVVLTLQFYSYNTNGKKGVAVSIEHIVVDCDKMYAAAVGD